MSSIEKEKKRISSTFYPLKYLLIKNQQREANNFVKLTNWPKCNKIDAAKAAEKKADR